MNPDPLHPIQIQRFREMSADEKWQVSLGLLAVARETRRVALRSRHPEWTEEQLSQAIARELMYART